MLVFILAQILQLYVYLSFSSFSVCIYLYSYLYIFINIYLLVFLWFLNGILVFKFCLQELFGLGITYEIAKMFCIYNFCTDLKLSSKEWEVNIIASDYSECMTIYTKMNGKKLMHEEIILFHFF